MVVTASEPRIPPITDMAQATSRFASPPFPMMSPASTNKGTASSGKLSRLPKITVCIAESGRPGVVAMPSIAVSSRIT